MIRWSLAVLVCLWLLLPVRLPRPLSGHSSAECLTLSDTAPDPQQPNLLSVFEECVAVNPTDVQALADLAWLYESRGRMDDAEAAYRRALKVDASDAEVRVRLARLLLKRGDVAGAREHAQAAREMHRNRQAVLDLLEESSGERSPGQ